MRILLAVILVVAALFALWQFDVIQLPQRTPPISAEEQAVIDLFEAVKTQDLSTINTQLGLGADVNAVDETGMTPLMYAASGEGRVTLVDQLINAGAQVNAKNADGWTPLMLALRDSKDLTVPVFLLNAGADPTLKTNDGQTVLDVAGIPTRSSPLYRRIETLMSRPFNPNWPSGYVVPVDGATLSSRASHLPGAPRAYRNGTHEGFDFYAGTVSVPITYGTPIRAVADGVVVRADHAYTEMTQTEYDGVIEASKNSLITPPELLDKLRGRQVWLRHPGGFVSRYAHLADIPADLQVGITVKQGNIIGTTGNSGTLEAVEGTQDGPHPHVEIWQGDSYLGQGLEANQIYELAAQVFGESSLPPYTESE